MAYDWSGEFKRMKRDELFVITALGAGGTAFFMAVLLLVFR